MTVLPTPKHEPTWISWVGATTTVLRALGADVDAADVAGRSGYAFHITVNLGLCPSGPTCLSWARLADGVTTLGRTSTFFHSRDCLTKESRSERTLAHGREAFELVTREIEAGRPCVVWGIGIPEFSVVHGVTEEEYVAVPWGPVPERSRWDELEAPGGPAVYAFPTPRPVPPWADRAAVRGAVLALSRPDLGPGSRCALGAYDAWIEILTAGWAVTHGNSYNAQCWAEARELARVFTGRLAERNPAVPALAVARDALADAAAALRRVAVTFPFELSPELLMDWEKIDAAIPDLRAARTGDERALAAFRSALASWPTEK